MAGRAANLLVAAGCVAGLAALHAVAFDVSAAASLDRRALAEFSALSPVDAQEVAWFLTRFFNPRPYAVAVVIVVAAAWLRGGLRLAASVAAILAGANVTTQLLQLATEASRHAATVTDASWPSGHTTAAGALAVGIVLLAPPVLRLPAVAFGVMGLLAVAYSVLIAATHLPSDALGAILVVGVWGALVASLRDAPGPGAAGRGSLWASALAGALSVAGLLVGLAAVRPEPARFLDRTAFVAVAAGLAVAAAALLAAAGAWSAQRAASGRASQRSALAS